MPACTLPDSGRKAAMTTPPARTPLLLPPALRRGSTVAIVSPSWGGPGAIPVRYEVGRERLAGHWGLAVREMPHALADPAWVEANPQARADDLHAALVDPEVDAIFASIGGDDSIRVLPHLDLELVRAHPKALLGFSDTTCLHMAWHRAGVVSFYGGAVMCGFAENLAMFDYFVRGIDTMLFGDGSAPGEWPENAEGWTVQQLDWEDPANQQVARTRNACTGWRWLQGEAVAEGPLIPGCLEVFDWLRGTPWWPSLDGAVLALETSEEAPEPAAVRYMLRALAATGDLARVGAFLLGRPGGADLPIDRHGAYDEVLLQVIRDECGRADMPIVTGMDFGHTDPIWTLPVGVSCRVDPAERTACFTEPCVSAAPSTDR